MCGCETGCAGYPPLDLGSEKAPPDEAHTRSRFSLDLYSRTCAPGNVFRHGHGHVREALTSPLGSSSSSGRARSSSHLQTAVLAHGRNMNGEGETLRVGTSDRHPQKAQTLYTQRRPFLHTLHDRLKAGARFVDQSKNGATGPENQVRWGGYHAGNAGESRLAVRCLLDDPLPTCAKTRKCQLHHQGGLISRT